MMLASTAAFVTELHALMPRRRSCNLDHEQESDFVAQLPTEHIYHDAHTMRYAKLLYSQICLLSHCYVCSGNLTEEYRASKPDNLNFMPIAQRLK